MYYVIYNIWLKYYLMYNVIIIVYIMLDEWYMILHIIIMIRFLYHYAMDMSLYTFQYI